MACLKSVCLSATLAAAIILGGAHSAWAQQQPLPFNPSAHPPEINSIPVLANMVKDGAKLYYLGERSGLNGWFIIKGKQIQMIYVTQDQQTALIGGMFTAKGENITGPQIKHLAETNNDIKRLIDGTTQQQKEVTTAGSESGGVASVSGDKESSEKKTMANNLPAVTSSPGERLLQDLKAAAGVSLGASDTAPELMMVAAPGCPNCKETWNELRDSVKSGKIRVRIIPVYNSLGGDESRIAGQLLRVANPLDAWDRFVSGDKTALDGTPDEAAMRAIVANLTLVSKWSIQGYPYLAYRGQDGRVKIVQGRPERMAAVLADLSR